ncbi:OLC1v1027609C1 [Oldenlandia corymbosa var. corymbosa]|uniref:AP-3 complex subunit beta n=1 Tax=Oldenlandia corymbosa var. corymbosa TaxID=529605 RepID=A0AAV1CD42_OLDCO|nr:OLC1v1027609C1 [Oldenlandia corymbosa var. corymbosa]
MFTQFGATAESLSKASTMVFRIGTDAHLYDDPDDVSIAPLLDSKFDSEKCEALKRLLALIAQGFDVSNYFPQVVKNVASQSIEVKKLVYLYLLHYAEKRPNEALLSINCFQKDLGDTNPLVRAWALRTMAGIRLHVIAPLVLVAVSKCVRDPSVYVRKCAANALPKLHDLRLEENVASIEELVGILLNDNSPGVVGAAAAAFNSVCPNNLFLIGRNYRRLCETLPDVEEWGQIVLIGILLRYAIARHGLVKESIMVFSHASEIKASDEEDSKTYPNDSEDSDAILELKKGRLSFTDGIGTSEIANMVSRSYLEGPDKYISQYRHADKPAPRVGALHYTSAKDNDDIRILLLCTSPLLWSHNSAVVLAAAGVHWIMAPKEDIKKIVKPHLFLLRSSSASKYLVLCNIQVFAKSMPFLFAPHFEDFFISISDSSQVKALKLEILSLIATESSISSIFQEFQDYVKDPDRKFAADTVIAIGLCAERFPKVANTCLEGLLAIASSELNGDIGSKDGEALVLIQAIHSIKAIIRKDPSSYEKVIVHLIRKLDSIRVAAARGMIIWMVGEYNDIGPVIKKVLPVVLRYLAQCFAKEDIETKLQILNSCTKVLLHSKEEELLASSQLFNYLLDLARCDLNYDVRDRARLVKELLSFLVGSNHAEGSGEPQHETRNVSRDLAESIFVRQLKEALPEPLNARFYLPGSLSQVVLHAAPGYEPLPRPCSLTIEDFGTSTLQGVKVLGDGASQSELDSDDPDSVSGSLNEESDSDYSNEDSVVDSDSFGDSNVDGSSIENGSNAGPLIHLSDFGNPSENQNGGLPQDNSNSGSNNLEELISGRSLESWLDEKPSSTHNVPENNDTKMSSARISIGDIASRVKHRTHALLDPANSNGLRVEYMFLSETSTLSSLLVCLQVSFVNCSTEPMSSIQLVEDNKPLESSEQGSGLSERTSPHGELRSLVPMEDISSLEPGQTTTKIIQVQFHHHLLPLKLVLWCNDKAYPVKLRPDIGYFVKPLALDVQAFSSKEAQLPGMFEYTRRCIFIDHIDELKRGDNPGVKDHFLVICECLALKVLSNTNLFLVSVDMPVSANLDDASGLRLRFSGELLSNSFPCLVSLALEGTCFEPLNITVKVNCEETVFGLNLLNRIVNSLSDSV